jgi:hypothetical protein
LSSPPSSSAEAAATTGVGATNLRPRISRSSPTSLTFLLQQAEHHHYHHHRLVDDDANTLLPFRRTEYHHHDEVDEAGGITRSTRGAPSWACSNAATTTALLLAMQEGGAVQRDEDGGRECPMAKVLPAYPEKTRRVDLHDMHSWNAGGPPAPLLPEVSDLNEKLTPTGQQAPFVFLKMKPSSEPYHAL